MKKLMALVLIPVILALTLPCLAEDKLGQPIGGYASERQETSRFGPSMMMCEGVYPEEESMGYPTVLGSEIPKSEITSIQFSDTIDHAPENAWDASFNMDGSVLAWVESGVLTIAGDGGVLAPEDSDHLLADYPNVREISFNGCFDTSRITCMSGMFYGCESLEMLDVTGFDTSNVTEMDGVFYNCNSLRELDLSGFDTSCATTMIFMFSQCRSLKKLTMPKTDSPNLTDVRYMFYQCGSLENLDVSSLNTARVTNMEAMFYECYALKSIDVSGFDTGCVLNMTGMFGGCHSLETLDVSSFDTSNVEDMREMFITCWTLDDLDLSDFDTANVTNMEYMFAGCQGIDELDITSFQTSNVLDMSCMFMKCNNLKTIHVGTGFSTAQLGEAGKEGMLDSCPAVIDVDGTTYSQDEWLSGH